MAGLVLRLGAGLVVAGGGALLATKLADVLQQARQRVQLGRTPCGNPLPREVHAVLPAAETADRRIIIVGDIHGCAGGCGLGAACERLVVGAVAGMAGGPAHATMRLVLHIIASNAMPCRSCLFAMPPMPCHAMPCHMSVSSHAVLCRMQTSWRRCFRSWGTDGARTCS